jgi:hypothetical protein
MWWMRVRRDTRNEHSDAVYGTIMQRMFGAGWLAT